MPGLGLHEMGTLPSGAVRLDWTPAAQATGYALAIFGGNPTGDVIIWTSARSASITPSFDYDTSSAVRQLVASGAALPPGASECLLPSEVAQAVPQGMVMQVGYGPEVYFSDVPKAPKWTACVRFKTTDMMVRGMGGMGGGYATSEPQSDQQPQQEPRKNHRIGLGDVLGSIPH